MLPTGISILRNTPRIGNNCDTIAILKDQIKEFGNGPSAICHLVNIQKLLGVSEVFFFDE